MTGKLKLFSRNQPVFEFVVKILMVYGVWKLFRFFMERTPVMYGKWESLAYWLGDIYARSITWVLETIFGFKMVHFYPLAVYPVGTEGFLVKDHCLGIPATVIFAAFIIVFQGPWKHKLWFIPLGMLGVQLINWLRVFLLAISLKHNSDTYYQFNHSITGVIFTYGLILLLIHFWIKYYWDKK